MARYSTAEEIEMLKQAEANIKEIDKSTKTVDYYVDVVYWDWYKPSIKVKIKRYIIKLCAKIILKLDK